MKQVDFHSERSKSASRIPCVLRRIAIRVAQLNALNVKATAVFDVKVIMCVLLGGLRATDLMGESMLLDVSFGRVVDFAFECE